MAEAIQTVMRRHGMTNAYEQLKDFTRGQSIDKLALTRFIHELDIPKPAKDALLKLAPSNYTGLASLLVKVFS